jgi:cytochrome P450
MGPWTRREVARLPRGPLGALRAFRRDPLGLLERAAALGDVVTVPLPRFDAWLLNHPDLARDVLVTGQRDFRKGRATEDIKRVLGEGLLTSEGELHRRQRRLVQPIFQHRRIADLAAAMAERAERLPTRWDEGATIDVHGEMARLTLSIVAATLFAADVGGREASGVGTAMRDLLRGFERLNTPYGSILDRLPLPTTRRVTAALRFLDDVVARMIAERRATGATGDDVLSILLRAGGDGPADDRRAGGNAGPSEHAGRMSDRLVRDEVMTLFLAGHETTSNALAFTWHLLGREPDAEAALHDELDTVLADRRPGASDVEELPVTTAVVREAMRLYPPSWILGRRALVDHEVDGVTIPAGDVAVVSQWLLHRDPRWWDRPAAFRLDRFAPDAERARPALAYLPFGAGPRGCIGEPFAWLELVIVVATLARRWRFLPIRGHRLELEPILTLRPRGGLPMRPVRRG